MRCRCPPESRAPFSPDVRVDAVRQLGDQIGQLGVVDHLAQACVIYLLRLLVERDVLGERGVEDVDVLGDVADVSLPSTFGVGDVDAVDEDTALWARADPGSGRPTWSCQHHCPHECNRASVGHVDSDRAEDRVRPAGIGEIPPAARGAPREAASRLRPVSLWDRRWRREPPVDDVERRCADLDVADAPNSPVTEGSILKPAATNIASNPPGCSSSPPRRDGTPINSTSPTAMMNRISSMYRGSPPRKEPNARRARLAAELPRSAYEVLLRPPDVHLFDRAERGERRPPARQGDASVISTPAAIARGLTNGDTRRRRPEVSDGDQGG